MKMLTKKMLLVAFVTMLIPYLPVTAQSAPEGLEVSAFESRFVPYWSSGGEFMDSHNSIHNFSSRPARFETSAVFRNTGTKVIKSVAWECLFFGDAQQTDVMLKYKFRDRKRIAPGEEARLKHGALNGAATSYKSIRITRVVYEDGTIWQAAKGRN